MSDGRTAIRDDQLPSRIIACIALWISICLPHVGHTQDTSPAALVEQFKNERVFWRQFKIAQEMVELRNTRVLPELVGWLDHWDRHARGNTAYVFAGLGDVRGFEVLTGIIRDRSDRPLGQGIPGNTVPIGPTPIGGSGPRFVQTVTTRSTYSGNSGTRDQRRSSSLCCKTNSTTKSHGRSGRSVTGEPFNH